MRPYVSGSISEMYYYYWPISSAFNLLVLGACLRQAAPFFSPMFMNTHYTSQICVLIHIPDMCTYTHPRYVYLYTSQICVLIHIPDMCTYTHPRYVYLYTSQICVLIHIPDMCTYTHPRYVYLYTSQICVLIHIPDMCTYKLSHQ